MTQVAYPMTGLRGITCLHRDMEASLPGQDELFPS